jgi:hypothetical protein
MAALDRIRLIGQLQKSPATGGALLFRRARAPRFTVPPRREVLRSYTVKHVHIYRVAEGWALRDDIGMLRQLGALS